MAKKEFAGEWCDVILNNLVEEIKALLKLGIDVSRVWAECETLLGDGPWDLEKLAKTPVPSRVYNRLQEVLKECAGHVHWIQHAAEQAYRKDMAFGGSEGLKRLAGNWVLGFLTKIKVGMALTNDGTATYNENKRWQILYADRRCTVIRMIYIPGPHGEMRCAEDEPRSVLDRVGHVLRSIAIMWKHKRHGVRVLSCNIHPQTRLDQEAPGTKCEVRDGVFYIGDERYGRIVYLEHSRLANGVYLGVDESRDEPFEGGRPAILVEKNYETRCTRTGKYFPILEAGQVYRHELPLEEAIFEIVHEPNWSRRTAALLFPLTILIGVVRGFFTWLLAGKPNLVRLMYKNRINDQLAMEKAQRQREAAEAKARGTEQTLRTVLNAPNDGFLESVRLAIDSPGHPRAFKRQKMPMAVMFVDTAGFTTWSEELDAELTFDFADRMLGICQKVCFRHGALIFKGLGDGLMAVFPMGYEGDFRKISLGDLVCSALEAAQEIMHEVRSTLVIPGTSTPPDLRIGINAGIGAIGVLARQLDIMTPVANFASRAENVCDPNEVVVTTEALLEMATPEERFAASTANAEYGIMIGVARAMLFVGNGIRRAKQNHVETWAFAKAMTPRIMKQFKIWEAQVAARKQQRAHEPPSAGLEAISFEDIGLSPGGSRVILRPHPAQATATALLADTRGDPAANEQQGDTSPDAATGAMLAVHADDEAAPEAVPPRRDTDPGPPDFLVEDIRETRDDRALAERAKRIRAPTGTHGGP